jgi:hypothetical protein
VVIGRGKAIFSKSKGRQNKEKSGGDELRHSLGSELHGVLRIIRLTCRTSNRATCRHSSVKMGNMPAKASSIASGGIACQTAFRVVLVTKTPPDAFLRFLLASHKPVRSSPVRLVPGHTQAYG